MSISLFRDIDLVPTPAVSSDVQRHWRYDFVKSRQVLEHFALFKYFYAAFSKPEFQRYSVHMLARKKGDTFEPEHAPLAVCWLSPLPPLHNGDEQILAAAYFGQIRSVEEAIFA